MAIYSRPMGVDAFKGSTGGVTFQVAGASSSVRQRRVPRNIRTVSTSKSRNAFAHIRSNWRTLSAGEKTSYDSVTSEYPRTNSLGVVYTVQATTLFTRLNKPLVDRGYNFNTSGSSPVAFPVPSIVSTFMEVSPVDIGFELSPTNVPTGYNYTVSASALFDYAPSDLDSVQVFVSHSVDAGGSTAINWGAGWSSKFGDNSSYNGKFVVLALSQLDLSTGEIQEFSRVAVEIGA